MKSTLHTLNNIKKTGQSLMCLLILSWLGLFLTAPFIGHAQVINPNSALSPQNLTPGYTLLAPLPGTYIEGDVACSQNPSGSQSNCYTTLPTYLKGILPLMLGVGSSLAVIVFMIGGLEYMYTDVMSKKNHGRELMTKSVIGLLLLIVGYLILGQINPKLLEFKFSPENTGIIKVGQNNVQAGLTQAQKLQQERYAIIDRMLSGDLSEAEGMKQLEENTKARNALSQGATTGTSPAPAPTTPATTPSTQAVPPSIPASAFPPASSPSPVTPPASNPPTNNPQTSNTSGSDIQNTPAGTPLYSDVGNSGIVADHIDALYPEYVNTIRGAVDQIKQEGKPNKTLQIQMERGTLQVSNYYQQKNDPETAQKVLEEYTQRMDELMALKLWEI